jgi:cleavage stimulation factor subunit 3
MADDAELAFLNAQQNETEYDPATSYEAAGEEEYDPADNYSPDAHSDQSASMPESAGNSPRLAADGEGENGLKPQPAPASAEVSAAPTPSKQPRTRGGFVDESEDEEEEPVEQPKTAASALLNAAGSAESPQRSFTNTPKNTLATPDVQLHSAQDQGASSLLSASVAVNESVPSIAYTVPNGSTPVPDVTMTGAPDLLNAASGRQSTAPVTPMPTSTALPKARLPQDRIGILEDRIAEDPRGDVEAWLSLIEEHRRRHKHDDARAAFDRFLKIFPTAVSSTDLLLYSFTNLSRVSNGLNGLPSRRNLMSYKRSRSCLASPSRKQVLMFHYTRHTSTLFDDAST